MNKKFSIKLLNSRIADYKRNQNKEALSEWLFERAQSIIDRIEQTEKTSVTREEYYDVLTQCEVLEKKVKVAVPDGFMRQAESLLTGTGGVVATSYIGLQDGVKMVYILINNPAENKQYGIGPMSLYACSTIEHVLRDTLDLCKIRR